MASLIGSPHGNHFLRSRIRLRAERLCCFPCPAYGISSAAARRCFAAGAPFVLISGRCWPHDLHWTFPRGSGILTGIMKCIEFSDVSFAYPPVEGDVGPDGAQIVPAPVFDHFTGEIPSGFTSLVGPNGSGKTTFLMLASGRLVPQNGRCVLFGQDVAALGEEQKNLLASVIYQNMEFETDEKVARLLDFVYKNGALKGAAKAIRGQGDLLSELIGVFELEPVLDHGLTGLSKGEIQRTLLAFCLLYGSASCFMDEPMFAMEERQKEQALAYLKDYAVQTGTAFFISMHEIALSRRYADSILLFYPDRTIDYGTPEEVLTGEALEKAYGVPAAMLKHSEDMTREVLLQAADAVRAVQEAEATAAARRP